MTQRIFFGISDVDSAEERTQRRVLAGTAVVLTLGELSRKAVKSSHVSQYNDRRQGHPVPRGCMWSRDCGGCPWTDCIMPESGMSPVYDSKKATRLRSGLTMVTMRQAGVHEEIVANVFGVHPRNVRRCVEEILGVIRLGQHRDMLGMSPQEIAEKIVWKLHSRKL